jgi:crotonobetainyl-CoA:carnitine CoA-transferase CaiB-like acyl-CoA transferase
MSDSPLPLSHITVLDLTRHRAGPTAARQLADWGANVIKVEEPAKGQDSTSPFDDRSGSDFQNLHRNKRSITIDFKTPEGVATFKRLAAKADVVLENYRPDVKHRLGIDYETLSKENPRLIYGSISGFGQTGPYRNRPGVDQIAQGMGGLMSITGLPGQGPVRAGIALCDTTSGLYCAMGVLLAIIERDRSGKGQWVNTSLLQSIIALLDFQAVRWLVSKEVPQQAGNAHPTAVPTNVFKTTDGYINIAATGQIFDRLCEALEAPHLLADPDFCDWRLRSKHRERLHGLIGECIAKRSSQEWIDRLNKAGVPCGPIYTIDQMFADPQVQTLNMARPVQHPILGEINLVGQGVNLERTPWTLRNPIPPRGENTDEVLREFGFADGEIAALHEKKAV